MSNIITVKVIRVPGAVSEVGLDSGSTVEHALAAADTVVGDNEKLQVNGADATDSTRLNDGDRVVISKGAKGNS